MAFGEIFAAVGEKIVETAKTAAELGKEAFGADINKKNDFSTQADKNISYKSDSGKKMDLSKKTNENSKRFGLDTRKPLDLTKQNDVKNRSVEKIKNDYIDDMKSKSEFSSDIDKNAIMKQKFEKISPETVSEKRQEFKQLKGSLRDEWSEKNGVEWPRYKTDVYDNGVCIRKAGQMYDAHHKQPLEFGGKNEASNITPFHAKEHYDSRGIHSKDSPFKQLEEKLGEK